MSEEPERNTQVVRKAFDAFTRRNADAAVEIMDPSIELHLPATAALAGEPSPYRGHDGVRRYFEHVKNVWERLEVFLHEYHEAENRVLVVGRVRSQGRDGQIGDIPVHWVWEIEDGKIVKGSVFTERDEALAAAGVESQEA